MTDLIYLILTIAGTLVGVVASIAGLFAGIGYYKQGKTQQTDSVVGSADQLTSFWKDQVEGFKDIVETQNEKIRTLTGELGELRGQLNAEKKQNEQLEKIFQGRDPETQKFMETMLAVAKQQQDYMIEDRKYKEDQHNALVAIIKHLGTTTISEVPSVRIEGTLTKQP